MLSLIETREAGPVLEAVTIDVLEDEAFLFADADTDAPAVVGQELQGALMSFSGPIDGVLGLALPAELAAELTANILGLEPDDPEAAATAPDAFKEVLNVICGQFLTNCYGSAPVFELSIPQTATTDAPEWVREWARSEQLHFLVDEEPVLAFICAKAVEK